MRLIPIALIACTMSSCGKNENCGHKKLDGRYGVSSVGNPNNTCGELNSFQAEFTKGGPHTTDSCVVGNAQWTDQQCSMAYAEVCDNELWAVRVKLVYNLDTSDGTDRILGTIHVDVKDLSDGSHICRGEYDSLYVRLGDVD